MQTRRVLMVCTGNTCRSPLAQVLLKRLRPQWEVRSAGILARPAPASAHSRQVARERGLDLSDHQAQKVSSSLLHWADDVLCMTENHRRALQQSFPEATTQTLGREISDPVGQPLEVYERCADQIEEALQDWLDQQPQ